MTSAQTVKLAAKGVRSRLNIYISAVTCSRPLIIPFVIQAEGGSIRSAYNRVVQSAHLRLI